MEKCGSLLCGIVTGDVKPYSFDSKSPLIVTSSNSELLGRQRNINTLNRLQNTS